MAAVRGALKIWVLNACEKIARRVAMVVVGRKLGNSDRKRAADGAMLYSPVGWINGFSVVRHTYSAHAEAHGGFETGNAVLRAVKDVDPRKVLT